MTEEKAYNSRLSQSPAKAITEFYVKPRLAEANKFFGINLMLLKAHAVMLTERGVIKKEYGSALLKELLNIDEAGFEAITLNPELNDLYLNLNMILIQRLGEDVGGWLHIAMSRNDFDLTEARLHCRELINASINSLLELMKSLLEVSRKHVNTVMPGYTHHSQAAQPITLAHFLLGHYDAFARDVERLEQAFTVVNQSAMGSCALATTGFPVDRKRVAELIGCNGIVENSLDAAGGQDYVMQTGTDVAIAFSTMGRLVESLLLWNTADFGMVELADQYCSISSVMPQKKNPVGLEIIRAESVKAHNTVNAAFGVLKALPTANGREPNYIPSLVFDAVERFVFLAPVMGDIISTLKIKPDVMLRKAQEGFSTMTELADEIVRQSDISFHASYVLVSRLVANTIARGLKANQITTEMIDEVSVELINKPLNIPADAVKRALDPVENVRVRSVIGGPAPKEVERMLKARDKQQAAMSARLQKRLDALEAANKNLNGAAKKIAA
jgi:argininosuccinate lyase